MEFKDRIKVLRLERELSLTDLGAILGKTESACRAWELDRAKPDADTIIKLAKYFDCTTDYLLGLSGIRNEKHLKQLEADKKELDERIHFYSNVKFKNGNRRPSELIVDILCSEGINSVLPLLNEYIEFKEHLADREGSILYYEREFRRIGMPLSPDDFPNDFHDLPGKQLSIYLHGYIMYCLKEQMEYVFEELREKRKISPAMVTPNKNSIDSTGDKNPKQKEAFLNSTMMKDA